ncbi:MAG: hypothetical protein EBZ77_16835 [Chitinophagia bacterium]|nr:hypothetical protein [Chitinophagia bacterium]
MHKVRAQPLSGKWGERGNRDASQTSIKLNDSAEDEKENANAAKYQKMLEIVQIILFHRLDGTNDGI